MYYEKWFFAKEMLNKKLLLLHSQGIYDRIKKDMFSSVEIQYKMKEKASSQQVDLVKLKHFKVGLYFLAVAYGIGVLVLIIEIIVYKVLHKEE